MRFPDDMDLGEILARGDIVAVDVGTTDKPPPFWPPVGPM